MTRRGRVTHTNDNDRTRSVYSWGSGVNYALGHGGRDDVATPRRVDFTDVVLETADEEKNDTTGGFRDDAISVSCSKFHSVVAFRDGSVFAWGHGRGGRLGVMDAGVMDAGAEGARGEKRVRNARIKNELGVTLLYPTYREGLTAIAEGDRTPFQE